MTRKRRENRPVQPRKLDQSVVMFAYIQESTDWREWRKRSISLRQAMEMVKIGEAKPLTRKTPNGIVTMYREATPCRSSKPSPATLTFATMQAVANDEPGVKLTRSEFDHVVKFRIWPFVGGENRAVTVRPRTTALERLRAQQYFDSAAGVRPERQRGNAGRGEGVRTLHFDAMPVAESAAA